jgi:ABC-2 type transport system permease protein
LGLLEIRFKGDVPVIIAAASLIIAYLALAALLQLLIGDLSGWASPAHRVAGVGYAGVKVSHLA